MCLQSYDARSLILIVLFPDEGQRLGEVFFEHAFVESVPDERIKMIALELIKQFAGICLFILSHGAVTEADFLLQAFLSLLLDHFEFCLVSHLSFVLIQTLLEQEPFDDLLLDSALLQEQVEICAAFLLVFLLLDVFISGVEDINHLVNLSFKLDFFPSQNLRVLGDALVEQFFLVFGLIALLSTDPVAAGLGFLLATFLQLDVWGLDLLRLTIVHPVAA